MRVRITPWMVFSFSCAAAMVAAACSGSDASAPGPKAGDDAGPTPPPETPPNPTPPPNPPPPGPQTATFAYAPSWAGVTKVEVLGNFGQADDWNTPLLTLTSDGTGTFRGTATLAAGSYAYVFRVTGDAAAAKPDTYVHYAIDPTDPTILACPAESPTYSKTEPNPCSKLTVPQASPAALSSIQATVKLSGAEAAQYLVVLERIEPSSHHFFVDRATTGADGKVMLHAAAGTYRLQVLHPTYYAKTDAQRAPDGLGAVRRTLSSPFMLDADVTLDAAEVAYGGYAAMQPRGAATLPVTLAY